MSMRASCWRRSDCGQCSWCRWWCSTRDWSQLELVRVNHARNACMGEGAISVTPFSAVVMN
jgi:hypothetical protein